MKKQIVYICLIMTISFGLKAQEEPLKNNIAIGFQLSQYQKDFGFGVHLTSPLILHKSMGLRLKYNLMFFEYVPYSGTTTWTPYSNLGIGLIGIGGLVSPRIRLYGEGGILMIFSSALFSSQSLQLGGYGVFGFEFFTTHNFNYFIEIGGVGSGAVADKVPNQPIYSNGLSISTGFRIVL